MISLLLYLLSLGLFTSCGGWDSYNIIRLLHPLRGFDAEFDFIDLAEAAGEKGPIFAIYTYERNGVPFGMGETSLDAKHLSVCGPFINLLNDFVNELTRFRDTHHFVSRLEILVAGSHDLFGG